jgi:hypothetical protein
MSPGRSDDAMTSVVTIPLTISSTMPVERQPASVGVPLPMGAMTDVRGATVLDHERRPLTVQTEPLARWSDGSLKWVLCDFVIDSAPAGRQAWTLTLHAGSPPASYVDTSDSAGARIETGTVTLDLAGGVLTASCKDTTWRVVLPHATVAWTAHTTGPVRTTFLGRGEHDQLEYVSEVSSFASTGLLRIRIIVRNPRAARHAGGLWDLGDPHSHADFGIVVKLEGPPGSRTCLTPEIGDPVQDIQRLPLALHQNSSGGEAWNSRNHVDASGRPTRAFRGYRIIGPGVERAGLRAEPIAMLRSGQVAVAVAVPEFWQQFPRAIVADEGALRIELASPEGAASELQGGEQKTFTAWFDIDSVRPTTPLAWVHRPALVLVDAAWCEQCQVFPFFTAGATGGDFSRLMHEALESENSFFAKREIADEYGWRHFGDLYADHENEHYTGPKPVVSHYNNQYDGLNGLLLQYIRSGDVRWWQLADPLARHLYDIDIYHTDRDRPAYSGGMFWHTDHYRDASTATHRAYSRANKAPGRPYGGGPSSEHNWGSGLLTYFYLTGDWLARDAVLSLAQWVLALDDGAQTKLGLIDDGPTGRASRTGGDLFHGPGRGGGNSINALLDAWLLTGAQAYLHAAERLLQRCIHPADDLQRMDVTNPEHRWSYTVFLSVVARYLHLKRQARELDHQYAYARAALLHYSRYMAAHERPYFDQAESLDYPNETWAAQEMRKANVLRLAAPYFSDEAERVRAETRGQELADRAWADVFRFATRTSTRCLSIMITEGARDGYLRRTRGDVVAEAGPSIDVGQPQRFLPQRARIARDLRTWAGLRKAAVRVLQPARWRRALRARQV